MAEITKADLIERERQAWKDLVRRLEFAAEIIAAKSDKVLVKDASTRLNEAIDKFKSLMRQRAQLEFAGK